MNEENGHQSIIFPLFPGKEKYWINPGVRVGIPTAGYI
jgi:hypothetical protein